MSKSIELQIKMETQKAEEQARRFNAELDDLTAGLSKSAQAARQNSMNSIDTKLRKNAAAAALFGNETDSLAKEQLILRREAERLVRQGLDPQDEYIKTLTRHYDRLGNEIAETTMKDRSLNGGMKKTSSSFGTLVKGVAAGNMVFNLAQKAIHLVSDELRKSAEVAANSEETWNLFNVTYSNIGDQANETAKQLADSIKIAESTAASSIGMVGDMFSGFGASQEEALEWGANVSSTVADLMSFRNLTGSMDDNVRDFTSGLMGNNQVLKRFGAIVLESDVKARLMAKGMDGLTGSARELAEAQERFNIVVEQNPNAMGDMQRTLDSTTNSQRRLDEALKKSREITGDHINQFLTPWKNKMSEIVEMTNKARTSNEDLYEAMVRGYKSSNVHLLENTESFDQLPRTITHLNEAIFNAAKSTGLYKEAIDMTQEVSSLNRELTSLQSEFTGTSELVETSLDKIKSFTKMFNSGFFDDATATTELITEAYENLNTIAIEQLGKPLPSIAGKNFDEIVILAEEAAQELLSSPRIEQIKGRINDVLSGEALYTLKIDIDNNIQKKTWQEWFKEITGIDPNQFMNNQGFQASQEYLRILNIEAEQAKAFFNAIGQDFNLSEYLDKQIESIQEALRQLYEIDPDNIDSPFDFSGNDQSANVLIKKLKELVDLKETLSEDDDDPKIPQWIQVFKDAYDKQIKAEESRAAYLQAYEVLQSEIFYTWKNGNEDEIERLQKIKEDFEDILDINEELSRQEIYEEHKRLFKEQIDGAWSVLNDESLSLSEKFKLLKESTGEASEHLKEMTKESLRSAAESGQFGQIGQLATGADPLTMIITSLSSAAMEIETFADTMNFIDTIVGGIFDVIGDDFAQLFEPTSIWLKTFGQILGQTVIPVLELATPILRTGVTGLLGLSYGLETITTVFQWAGDQIETALYNMTHWNNKDFKSLSSYYDELGEKYWGDGGLLEQVWSDEIESRNDVSDAIAEEVKMRDRQIDLLEETLNTEMTILEDAFDRNLIGVDDFRSEAYRLAQESNNLAQLRDNLDNSNEVGNIRAMATGGSFITSGPERILVGDNPGGKELVMTVPISSMGSNVQYGNSGGKTYQIFVQNSYGIEDLVSQIKEAERKLQAEGVA